LSSGDERGGEIRVRPAAVAGAFYPAHQPQVEEALADAFAGARQTEGLPPAKALVAPHAGWVYSGPIAASAYRTLEGREEIERVVLLGPSHYVPFAGLAASSADAFQTPLGQVPLDGAARELALSAPAVVLNDTAHAPEHSLEVQLPFLQEVLGDAFSLLPLAVGFAEPEEVAAVLDAVWGGPETLVVVSTDLSHYLDYEKAGARDRRTADAVLALDADSIGERDACGHRGLRGLLTVARARDMRVHLLDLRNSGDTAGDPGRVVGYGAFAIC
jgi:MEMO1 family protein